MSVETSETPRVNPEKEAAEIEKLRAEAAFSRAQTEKELALAESARMDTERNNIAMEFDRLRVEELRTEHDRKYASDHYHHTYRFNGSVDSRSVDTVIKELTVWDRTTPGCDIEIVFNSPGGSVIDGFDLYDFLQELKRKGHNLTIATRGMAASMGGILLQAGLPTPEAPKSRRVMGEESVVLIHEVSSMAMGKIGEIEDEVDLIHKLQGRALLIFANGSLHAFERHTSEIALTVDQFEHGDRALGVPGWNRKDWWLTSDECLKFGIVDEVR